MSVNFFYTLSWLYGSVMGLVRLGTVLRQRASLLPLCFDSKYTKYTEIGVWCLSAGGNNRSITQY